MYGKYTLFYKSSNKTGDITRMHKQCVPGLSLGGGAWERVWIQAGLIYDLEVAMVSLISMWQEMLLQTCSYFLEPRLCWAYVFEALTVK